MFLDSSEERVFELEYDISVTRNKQTISVNVLVEVFPDDDHVNILECKWGEDEFYLNRLEEDHVINTVLDDISDNPIDDDCIEDGEE